MTDAGFVVREIADGVWAAVKRNKWGLAKLAAAFGLGVLIACGPRADASDTDAVAMAVAASVAGDTITVTTNFKPGADDGKGGLDGFIVRTGTNTGAPKALVDSVSLPSSARTYTVRWVGNPVGAYSGYACVTARRRTLNSTPTCKAWSATVSDVAPPPPIVDSVVVAALRLLSPSGQMTPGSTQPICPVVGFSGDKWAIRTADALSCQSRYAAAFTTIQRAVSPTQQAVTDGLCFRYSTAQPDGQIIIPAGSCDAVAVPA